MDNVLGYSVFTMQSGYDAMNGVYILSVYPIKSNRSGRREK